MSAAIESVSAEAREHLAPVLQHVGAWVYDQYECDCGSVMQTWLAEHDRAIPAAVSLFDFWMREHQIDALIEAGWRPVAEHIEAVAEALRSCAGCEYETPSAGNGGTDGRLQECYLHGEQAAKYYLDYAIGAMYHFAGVEPPAPEGEL